MENDQIIKSLTIENIELKKKLENMDKWANNILLQHSNARDRVIQLEKKLEEVNDFTNDIQKTGIKYNSKLVKLENQIMAIKEIIANEDIRI